MLDIKFIRENRDIVVAGAKKKHIEVDIDRLLELDEERRGFQASLDEGRAKQNQVSKEVPSADKDRRETLLLEMKNLKETLSVQEEKMAKVLQEWRALMVQVPNVPDISVPEGDSDADNKETRTWGNLPKFSFDPKNHVELMLANDMADFERGAKVAGFRGYFLRNDGARLVWALDQFVQSRFAQKDFT
ncbi:MAG TPA: serine--tRNA ligase, partial [Candidatus Paceibacterota bacterium]|nr:serine--tRNA ligase [Candidatus Paceibacterota bacterium]